MGRIRADNAACAICMDSLFTKLDDLDQLEPACAPDCGHVFHESCIQDWFRAQSIQYLEQARAHRLDRDPSPTISDAPALCPTCRSECYADQETGEPVLHRLYINYGDDCGSSSQVGSSPVKSTGKSRRREAEVMGLARRAKGISEDVKALNDQSSQQAVDMMLSRADGLTEDAVSAKAIQGVKTYIGGLTIAINNLRSTLANNPLRTTLEIRVQALEEQLATKTRENATILNVRLPAALREAKLEERKVCDKEIKKVKGDLALVTRGLEQEKVQRRVQRQGAEEREQQLQVEMGKLKKLLKQEQEERETLQGTLTHRTKLLARYQSKGDTRKELKEKADRLEKENNSLRMKLAYPPAQAVVADRATTLQSPRMHEEDHDDGRQRNSPETARLPAHRRGLPRPALSIDDDDSLEIELPSFADDPSRRHISPKKNARAGPSTTRTHPTARTYTFDEDDSISAIQRKRKPNQSKYFQDSPDRNIGSSDQEDDSDILIQPSSPMRVSPTKRSRTNPFSTTREARAEKVNLVPKKKPSEVIDLASSSPGTPFKTLETNVPRPPPDQRSRPKSQNALAGIFTDSHGRPKKGLAMGAKIHHRA